MRKQLSFLQNKNLGYDKEQLMVVQLNVPRGGRLVERVRTGFEKAEQFKAELSKTPEVISVGASSHDFGYGGWTNIGYTDDNGTYRTFNLNIIDYDYMQTLKMEFAAGRNFSKDNPSDFRRGIIVNEALSRNTDGAMPLAKNCQERILAIMKSLEWLRILTMNHFTRKLLLWLL